MVKPPPVRFIWMGWRYRRHWWCGTALYYGWHLMAGIGPLVVCIWPDRRAGTRDPRTLGESWW